MFSIWAFLLHIQLKLSSEIWALHNFVYVHKNVFVSYSIFFDGGGGLGICVSLRWDGKREILSWTRLACILLCIITSDFFFILGELTCGRDIDLFWINIDTPKASTSVTNKELPGQYFGKVEQNFSCRKLGYILSTFHRPSQEGDRPSQGGILWKESPREQLLGCFFHCTLEWLCPFMLLLQALSWCCYGTSG